MATSFSPVLVARDEELKLIERCLETSPALVVVSGEAGIGKTRLVTEALAGIGVGRRILLGRCQPLRDPFPLGPVVEALRMLGTQIDLDRISLSPLAGALLPVLPELAAVLPGRPEPLPDAGMERHRLWAAAAELLGAVGPGVVVLEDLHWADPATAEFVVFLARQHPERMTLVLTWRSEDLPSGSPLPALLSRLPPSTTGVRIDLVPLPPAEVQRLVRTILGSDDVSEEFASWLHQRTSGVPFAVEEVLRLLQDRHDLIRWEGKWARRALDELAVPVAIRESILERLACLDPDARLMAQAAAVLGVPSDEALLATVAGLPADGATAACLAALESALLQESAVGELSFRHVLAADAVADAIPGPARRQLHTRAAEALDNHQPTPHTRLARHYQESGQTRSWLRHAKAAAAQATELGEHGAAAGFMLDALSAPGLSPETTGRIARDLSISALNGLVQNEVIAKIRRVADDPALPATLRGQLRFNLGALLHQAGDASAARRQILQAVEDLRHDPAGLALAMSALAAPWVVEGDLDEHLEWLDRSAAIAVTSADEGSDNVRASLEADRVAVRLAVGDASAWETTPSPPPPDAGFWDNEEWARACTNLAVNACYLGHYPLAQTWVTAGLEASEASGFVRFVLPLRTTEVLREWAIGEWDDLAGRAQALAAEQLDPPSAVQVAVVVGLLDLAGGRPDEAEASLTSALELAPACGAIPTFAMAAAGLARLRLAHGEPAEAATVALRALATVAGKNIWVWAAEVAPIAVESLVAAGRSEEAAQWARRLAGGIRGRMAPAAHAASTQCRAHLAEADGSTERAAKLYARAAKQWSALPRPYAAALACEQRARCLLVVERQVGAGALIDCLAAYHQLGADWDKARVRQLLRQHDLPLPYPWRGGHRPHENKLSTREREVVGLVSAGYTSAQIAKRLFLSPRTVDHHVERALPKLGLSSRKGLLGALVEPDPTEKSKIG